MNKCYCLKIATILLIFIIGFFFRMSRRNGSVSRAAETASKNRLHMDRNPQHSRITGEFSGQNRVVTKIVMTTFV